MIRLYKILGIALSLPVLMQSCTDYEDAPQRVTEPEVYDGTTLDYLRNTEGYDSILYIIDRIPGLSDELESARDIAFFAADNNSVRHAMETLNRYRQTNNIGKDICLDSILIKPFHVVDTILSKKLDQEDPNIIEYDSIFVKRNFDYRMMMDSVVCRYVVNANLGFDAMEEYGGFTRTTTFRYNQEMGVRAGRHDATGAVGLGTRHFELVDLNNSNVETNWIFANTACKEIRTRNGVIHFITDEHEYGFNQIIKKFKNRGTEKGVLTYAE